MIPFIPVRCSPFVIGGPQTKDEIALDDVKRFGKHCVGGILVNQGSDDVVINGSITLSTGESIPIGVHYPYIDKSTYTVEFVTGAGAPSRKLVFWVYKAFPDEVQK